jgi:hypothetical protein
VVPLRRDHEIDLVPVFVAPINDLRFRRIGDQAVENEMLPEQAAVLRPKLRPATRKGDKAGIDGRSQFTNSASANVLARVVLPIRRTPESQTIGALRQNFSMRSVQNGRGIVKPDFTFSRTKCKKCFWIWARPLGGRKRHESRFIPPTKL